MDDAQAVAPGNSEVRRNAVGTLCPCCAGKGACLLWVATELDALRTRGSEHYGRVIRLEGALVTARAEAVLLRRLLALAEHLRSEDLVTLAQIEATCVMCGYEPDGGQPVAVWLTSALESRG